MRSLVRYAKEAKSLAKKAPWAYKAASQLYIDRKFPRHLFIETTADCNLRCDFCPREDVRRDMDWPLFQKIVDEASMFGPRSFSLHLFGEPLLWPHIIPGIRYIKEKNPRHNVLLTTNGTHLNRFAEALIEAGTDEIIWTWRREAKFRPETIDKLRESTLKGICQLRVRLIQELTPPEAWEAWKDWPCLDVRSLHNYGGEITGSTAPESRWPCYHLFYAPAVAWNGNFLICCADPHQKEIIGNIHHDTIQSCWRKLEGIRKSHLEGRYEGICASCDVWKTYPDLFFGWQKTSRS